jgi:hypothetical protein
MAARAWCWSVWPGRTCWDCLPRQPWRVLGLARALAKAHRAVHEVRAPEDLPDLRQVLAARIDDAALPQPLRAFALRVLDGLPTGDRLCHGDFHPGNVLVAADRVGVVDWANAAGGVPEADHARTLLLLRWADPLPGTPLITRGLMAAGRSVFAHGYARTYGGSQHRLPRVDSWLTVHAAAPGRGHRGRAAHAHRPNPARQAQRHALNRQPAACAEPARRRPDHGGWARWVRVKARWRG